MSDVRTDTETVKRLAAALENGGVWSTGMQEAATTLLALLAERNRLAAEVEKWKRRSNCQIEKFSTRWMW